MKCNQSARKNKNLSPPRGRIAAGSVLVEAVVTMTILSVVGIVLLKGSMNVLAPRHWTLIQNLTDAQMTFEKAYSERIEFTEMTATASPWPVYPDKTEIAITLGTMPGGKPITGSIIRTRIPDENNFPAHGGSGTLATNPAEMQVWKLQSHLLYSVGGRDYIKSRTVIRAQ